MTREGSSERSEDEPSEHPSGDQREPRGSDGPSERSERGPSEKSSGEERSDDPRDREAPDERREVTNEGSDLGLAERREPRGSEEGTSEHPSGERDGERSEPSAGSSGDQREPRKRSEPRDSEGESVDDAVPLDISGHDDRDPPGESDLDELTGDPSIDDSNDPPTPETADDPTDPEDADPAIDDTKAAELAEEAEDSEEVEPVEVLVQLAEDGEIDPWDIDVVRVTDKFLDAVEEADLRASGRALFYASVLVRMKSDAMVGEDPGPDPPEVWEQAMMGDEPIDEPDPFASLEDEMERRLERRRARGMPQTLDELVRDLREAERDTWWKESRSYDTSDSPHGYRRGTQELDYRAGDDLRMDDEPTADDVTATAHAEDIDEVIADVEAVLREQYDAGREEVLYREVSEAGGSRVMTFLALLFLSHRGRVRLQQDDLFGDLWIQDPAADSGSEGALAD